MNSTVPALISYFSSLLLIILVEDIQFYFCLSGLPTSWGSVAAFKNNSPKIQQLTHIYYNLISTFFDLVITSLIFPFPIPM